MTRKTSFYYSFLVLPAPKRRAITAVFDFCRAVDDSVDLETDPARAQAALELWRAEIARVFGGQTPETAQGRALQPFVEPCHLPRAQLDALVDGVAMDATPRRYQTFADLEPYCHRVASSVGLVCAEIFGYQEPAVLDYARDLGVALQLTNILRDVAVDYRRGRVYLPLEDLTRFGCSEDDLRREVEEAGHGVRSERMRAVLEHHAARARVFFSRAARALPREDAGRFVPAEIMRAIYWELLQRIERAGCDVFSRVIRVSRPAQARLAFGIWWRLRSGRGR
jgi:15-cis-phytoene synthase